MKRFLAVLLTLTLLLTASAFAEDAIYLRQLPQYKYINDALLTEESYPEVCISPFYPYYYFGSNPKEPVFLCFPGPDGAAPNSFDSQSASYLDVENAIQYSYVVDESNSFEEFINKADKDEWILMDGSDGVAAVIFPDNRYARGMIATKEFGKSSKLRIQVTLDQLSSRMPEETRVTALTEAITAEVERVKNAMRYETRAPFWSAGKYSGVKLLSYDDFDYMLKVDFPTLALGSKTADMIVTYLKWGNKVEGIYSFEPKNYIEAELEFSNYSYPVYLMEDKDSNKEILELKGSDGRTWYVYVSYWNNKSICTSAYASTKLNYGQNHNQERYLTVHLNCNGDIGWTSAEEFLADAEQFTLTEMKAADDPYVPAEKVEPEEEPEEELVPAENLSEEEEGEPAGWICPSCGETNTGKFCGECGTPKPDSGKWACPSCGTENSGKFCTECGTPKP